MRSVSLVPRTIVPAARPIGIPPGTVSNVVLFVPPSWNNVFYLSLVALGIIMELVVLIR